MVVEVLSLSLRISLFFVSKKKLIWPLLKRTMNCNSCRNKSKMEMRRRRRTNRGSVRTKVKTLQKLIPGAEGLKADRLFLKTADYILHLRLQVDVLQALSNIYHP